MYRSKKDVDKHVQNLTSKLPLKEFQTRAYSIARLYFEVGDYASCQRYVEQYLTLKDSNAAAHKLLGSALQKTGQKEKALEHYKTSLDIDPTQTSTILDICELLADDDVAIDPGRAKYWCEKAEATFPRHPITFKLRERLLTRTNPDSEALEIFLKSELASRPKDVILHIRLLNHYLQSNQISDAFDHSCNVEFDDKFFLSSYTWYETLSGILKHNSLNMDWLYQLFLLTVKERLCVLSLTEVPNGSSRSLVECSDLLNAYDEALQSVHKAGAPPGFGEFHLNLVQHHRGQLSFHTATYLLKKAKKSQISWRDASKLSSLLMLTAWQVMPLDTKVNWLTHAPKKQQNAVHRWYLEGSYRCSQSGHYILSNIQENSQVFLDNISQFCAGAHWRDKIYEALFPGNDQENKMSYLLSVAFNAPSLRLPRKQEIEAYDDDAQREYPNSLHHFVWILRNYKNFANFKCSLFNMLIPTTRNYGAESLNKLDILAFLYSATLTTQNKDNVISENRPSVLPANITDLLCSLAQMKWWDCAYKYSQKELGTDLTGIHTTLSFGIETVRCIDNHGLDPELLCILGDIFSQLAKQCTTEEKNTFQMRACLYYSSAINLLEKLKSKISYKIPEKRLFDYTHKNLDVKELNALLEKCKIYVATCHLNEGEYEKAVDLLSNLKSPAACYYLGVTYKKLALDEKKTSTDRESEMKYVTLLNKAKHFAYKALEKQKQMDINYTDSSLHLSELIEDIECYLNKVDPDNSALTDFFSDENESLPGNDYIPVKSNSYFSHKQKPSSTPKPSRKHTSSANVTNYRTAVDTQILESSYMDQQVLERIEKQIKVLQKRDTNINDFMEQSKEWFDENRQLGNQIISTMNSNIKNTTEQFKLLKISVDQVKDQLEECKNECKDVSDLKKQISELKKEVNKLKKASSEQTLNESDLYNLDDEYRPNDNVSGFGASLPFASPQVMPQFARGLVPPFPTNPYQLYGHNFYNLYNQYSQFPQVSVPGGPQIFDPTRSQANYPGIYTTPDQMYLDVSQLVAPTIPTVPNVPTVSAVPSVPVPAITAISTIPIATSASVKMSMPTPKVATNVEVKKTSQLPVNVVITSSDPLPTCTSAPAPILSVTIPSKHIKGSPHNYQIPMPSINDTKGTTPAPLFSFPSTSSKEMSVSTATTTTASNFWTSLAGTKKQAETSHTRVDGNFTMPCPNNSLNKSRTLSEKSNTSIENYDPCPDFKPIIPLPAEVKITTGEEEELVIFSSRAKLYRFVEKQWKERGLGEMKLLKHKLTGKVRVLMRREQIHKVCANHIISAEMEIKPMKNETKAYFWVANDFAEETVILEKFCIRFKTPDIAKQFYDVFEEARQDALNCSKNVSVDNAKLTEESNKSAFNLTSSPNENMTTATGKTVVGGFVFSTTPTFKPLSESTKDEQNSEIGSTKSNIFSQLTFKTATNSPLSNIFTNIQNQKDDTPKKLNTSDIVEEFEPTVDFKPVIPLPALVDHKTGEENETVLFEHRAKLLRFDATAKEWKERGLGNIKLLVHNDNNEKIRLLMRREQIMKVCCNHAVTKNMVFQKMPNMNKAVTWCAKDFSDGELVAETFCLRFKTVQVCDNFVSAVSIAQSKIKDDSKVVKEEQNAAKINTKGGFGDTFKPKPGSWHCDVCYTNNLENFEQCACCEQPKPKGNSAIPASYNFGFGDKFKPKPGTWECKACMVRNEADKDTCSACNTQKDSSAQKSDNKFASKNLAIVFGIPGQTQTSLAGKKVLTVSTGSGWGDQFKPKEGSWECNQCFVRNDGNKDTCNACNSSRNPDTVTNTIKYSFGTGNVDIKAKNEVSNLFETPSTQNFKFGIPANQTTIVVSFGNQKATTSVFPNTTQSTVSEVPINFCLKKTDETKPSKPALLPTPQLNWMENKTFDFKGIKSTNQSNSNKSDGTNDNDQKQSDAKDKSDKNHKQVDLEDKKQPEKAKGDSPSDDVIFVKEIQATAEEKMRAKELMLPENYFTYKTKDPCLGCRGCKSDDEEVKAEPYSKWLNKEQKSVFGFSTPTRTTISNFQSPTISVYGTPNVFDKTTDTSIFRTPLGAANTKPTFDISSSNSVGENDSTNKENSVTDKTTSDANTFTTAKTPILMPPKLGSQSTTKDDEDVKPIPKTNETRSIFGDNAQGVSMNKPLFSFNQNKTEGAPLVKSIFGTDDHKPVNLFTGSMQGSMFGPGAMQKSFGFPGASAQNVGSVFGNTLNNTSANIFSGEVSESSHVTKESQSKKDEVKPVEKKDTPFKIDTNLSFAALSTSGPGFNTEKKPDFKWEGAGQQLFGTAKKDVNVESTNNTNVEEDAGTAAEEEYDPHYEPIVPLPDKVTVTTGEEDEEKLFGERCKLYRYDEKSREWKERGIGEMKLLYHSGRNSYRLLLRREQVHKAVLNMLIFKNLALLPLTNSDRAWTWAGQNFAEGAPEQEMLAVRFKSVALATAFYDAVVACVQKLQSTPEEVKQEEPNSKGTTETFTEVPRLRRPKHLETTARADADTSANHNATQQVQSVSPAGTSNQLFETDMNGQSKQVSQDMHIQAQGQEQDEEKENNESNDDDEEDCEEHDYDNSDGYYNEDDDDTAVYFTCDGEAVVRQAGSTTVCQNALVQLSFDQSEYMLKILVTDSNTGEILADMPIYTDTEFQMSGDSCTWSGLDYTSNECQVDKTVTINFSDSDTAMQFYDSCETSKVATYTSTEPDM